MLGVIFHWSHKKGLEARGQRALFQIMDYTHRAFGADKVVMVDKESSCSMAPGGISVVESLDDALALFDGYAPVYVSRSAAASSLRQYYHPEDAVYVVGPDYDGMRVPDDAECVMVDYPAQEMELWASVALGIVLYDRSVKP